MRVLIIEDTIRLATLIAEGLRQRGFTCDMVHDLASASLAVRSASYDALILDLGLPDGDGIDWLRRQQGDNATPTLILTARGALEDRVTGLDAGADDYMVKPFEMDELAARIRALLRRPGQRATTVLAAGPLRFDSAARIAHARDHLLDLSRREADLLELLMRRTGQVVRRAAIEDALYNFDDAVTPNAVEAIVSRLRRKLDEAGAPDMLHTVRGVGYLLREGPAC